MRLSCCLIARTVTSSFLREQQMSLYILYLFLFLTLTSLPFYFYRTMEIFFDIQILSQQNDTFNSRILAQIILCGVSFKPILYILLFVPKNILFKLKCFTSIQIEQYGENSYMQSDQYSIRLPIIKPRIRFNLRTVFTSNILHENDIEATDF